MSYLLDTTVASEAAKRQPHPGVRAWLKGLSVQEACLSVLTLGELVQRAVRAPEPRKSLRSAKIATTHNPSKACKGNSRPCRPR